MLRFFILAVLGILSGVLGTEETCRFNAHENCRAYALIPDPLPSNEEELQKACLNLDTIKKCITDYKKKNCSENGVDKEDRYFENHRYISKEDLERRNTIHRRILKDNQRLIEVSTEICQDDSELHEKFVPDILCFKEIFDANDKEQFCRNYTTNALDYLRSRLHKIREQRGNECYEHLYCLHVLLDMNCFLEKFAEKCSSQAKDTAIELIEKGGSLDEQCPVAIRLDVFELLGNLESATKKNNIYVRELLEIHSFF